MRTPPFSTTRRVRPGPLKSGYERASNGHTGDMHVSVLVDAGALGTTDCAGREGCTQISPCGVGPPPLPSRTNWTRLVPSSRTNWTRLVPSSGRKSGSRTSAGGAGPARTSPRRTRGYRKGTCLRRGGGRRGGGQGEGRTRGCGSRRGAPACQVMGLRAGVHAVARWRCVPRGAAGGSQV
jgi:hypothetical protein